MQRLLLETETAGSPRARKKAKGSNAGPSSNEFSENEEEEKDDSEEEEPVRSNARERKAERAAPSKTSKGPNAVPNSKADVREVLEQFFQQQMRMERQWAEMMERLASEHMLFEQEWRQYMEKLERERLMTERAWREREEQRRARDESRAERRDSLLTTLLTSLINEHSS